MTRPQLGDLVVATDFSAPADAALARAQLLRLRPGAGVEIVHVSPRVRDEVAAARLRTDAEARLEGARAALARGLAADGHDHPVRVYLGDGDPGSEIATHAHHGRAELVVLGRHGAGHVADVLLGTTAERVVRHGTVPALVVAAAPAHAYRRPLVAFDLSPASTRALELVRAIVDPAVAVLDVVYVIESEADRPATDGELWAALAEVGVSPAPAPIVRIGAAVDAILAVARERGADLVAVGTHGRRGLSRAVLGSVADAVVRRATCDVLVAPRPSA